MDKTHYSEHGVFISVDNIGLLIKGDAGSGKSSLALELIERGHRFISDDVVLIEAETDTLNPQRTQLIGKSPEILKNLLAVRDLGVMNISELFSAEHCLTEHTLDLIIQLVDDEHKLETHLSGIQSHTEILGLSVPVQLIHAHPKRNLALIVETAVKNYILYKNNQGADELLKQRQQDCITGLS